MEPREENMTEEENSFTDLRKLRHVVEHVF